MAALLLDPISSWDLWVKWSRAYTEKGKWEDALNDTNKVVYSQFIQFSTMLMGIAQVIEFDSSSPLGYKRKYAVLLSTGHHSDTIDVFKTMLLKMSELSDPEIHDECNIIIPLFFHWYPLVEHFCYYVQPEQTKEAINTSIKNLICDLPLVLINTSSGHLCNKSEQAATFKSTPTFTTLITSMTTHIDYTLVDKVVEGFYHYGILSHTWQGSDLYKDVIKIVVYNLKASPTHEKLQMFYKIVWHKGFIWAWSDTCCTNQKDPLVLQESLISMYKWYKRSVMTIIFLYDINKVAKLDTLIMSKWNSQG